MEDLDFFIECAFILDVHFAGLEVSVSLSFPLTFVDLVFCLFVFSLGI